jgi:hypothetical protein
MNEWQKTEVDLNLYDTSFWSLSYSTDNPVSFVFVLPSRRWDLEISHKVNS